MMPSRYLLSLLLLSAAAVAERPVGHSRRELIEMHNDEAQKYLELRKKRVDEVSDAEEAARLRNYQLRKKKRKGILSKKGLSFAQVLFPGVSPEEYHENGEVVMYTASVNSKKTQVPFEFYDLPTCPQPLTYALRKTRIRKNLGIRLQGVEQKPAPFVMKVKQNHGCKGLCVVATGSKELRWMHQLIERQYRVHLTFDQLPVLVRIRELNYAARGYPIGFKAPSSTGREGYEYYIYNHFTVNYREDASGIRITGFDVHPVSFAHQIDVDGTYFPTCDETGASEVVNDPSTCLALRTGPMGEDLKIPYSYEVKWLASDLGWADRWDVYLIGAPDENAHYLALISSLMILLLIYGGIASIVIRTLRKDIASCNDTQAPEKDQAETGWKLVRGDVFRPPQFSPMLLSVLVGTGSQLGVATLSCVISATIKLFNPMEKGVTLTAILITYVLCGTFGGYISARIFKFCDANDDKAAWKQNAVYTATGLPGALMAMFIIVNIFLSFVGASNTVSFSTITILFALWLCVSTPLVFVGSFLGFRSEKLSVPSKKHPIARVIPTVPWYAAPPFSILLGGILPFGVVYSELVFIMSSLWLHQFYYVMGFFLAVLIILAAACAEVAIVMCYLQLCNEDHRWWWKSFCNCASAGLYLFVYSLWFLNTPLGLADSLSVMIYLTYMLIISVCFGLFCGSVGFVVTFLFNKTIYSAITSF